MVAFVRTRASCVVLEVEGPVVEACRPVAETVLDEVEYGNVWVVLLVHGHVAQLLEPLPNEWQEVVEAGAVQATVELDFAIEDVVLAHGFLYDTGQQGEHVWIGVAAN